jgi:2-polyprenyl-3-methyl-5-hydroxy-6-metoxy-1,4-benzoquinol methylase
MDNFLPQKDELSRTIQEQSANLYQLLEKLDINQLQIPENCLYYLKASHMKRLFFSIETSAHLLYRSVMMKGKSVSDTVIMDYGAGVGTLYMLAKMIGCKKVIYNDHLEEWKQSAAAIASAINVHVDEYIVGDIDDTLQAIGHRGLKCDIIISRNVIEHIYRLEKFYGAIAEQQSGALVYSSTTANYYNPGAHIKHVIWHRKWEKEYRAQRMKMIKAQMPGAGQETIDKLAIATRGLAGRDIEEAVKNYISGMVLPHPSVHRSNTCDPFTGVWAEHLLKFGEYRKLIGTDNYRISFAAGFWDTHYSRKWKNMLGWVLNPLIRFTGRAGILVAPFIYVIAEPAKTAR